MDMGRTLVGGDTDVLVSDTLLASQGPRDRISLGLDGTLGWGRHTLGGGLRAHGMGSGDSDYAAYLDLRIAW